MLRRLHVAERAHGPANHHIKHKPVPHRSLQAEVKGTALRPCPLSQSLATNATAKGEPPGSGQGPGGSPSGNSHRQAGVPGSGERSEFPGGGRRPARDGVAFDTTGPARKAGRGEGGDQ